MSKKQFLTQLRFWLYFAMSSDKQQDYIKAFEEFFVRGAKFGRTEAQLCQTLGTPKSLADKMINEDKTCMQNAVKRIAITALILLAIALLSISQILTKTRINFAIFFLVIAVALPAGTMFICGGAKLFTSVQNSKNLFVMVLINVSICIVAMLPACAVLAVKAYDSFYPVAVLAVIILLLVYLAQTIQIIKYGISSLSLLVLNADLLSIIFTAANIVASYKDLGEVNLMLSAILTGQMLPLMLELIVLTALITVLQSYMMKKMMK
ncbi:MAG: DUF1700 domain-containing protein [Oscillospiraceae bacterium]